MVFYCSKLKKTMFQQNILVLKLLLFIKVHFYEINKKLIIYYQPHFLRD